MFDLDLWQGSLPLSESTVLVSIKERVESCEKLGPTSRSAGRPRDPLNDQDCTSKGGAVSLAERLAVVTRILRLGFLTIFSCVITKNLLVSLSFSALSAWVTVHVDQGGLPPPVPRVFQTSGSLSATSHSHSQPCWWTSRQVGQTLLCTAFLPVYPSIGQSAGRSVGLSRSWSEWLFTYLGRPWSPYRE